MAEQSIDVLIVGGGLAGASLALALEHSGYSTLMVEAQPFSALLSDDFDARTLALSPASQRILEMLNVWPLLAAHATPIQRIHVSEQGRFGATQLTPSQPMPLGQVIELQAISRALHQLLPTTAVLAPASLTALDLPNGVATIQSADKPFTIQAKLIVAADGGQSLVRKLAGLPAVSKAYGQVGLVANIGLQRDHAHCAYERFTKQGPLAMLPMTQQRAAMIWCLPPKLAEDYLQCDDKRFLSELQRAFGYKLGRFVQLGRRATYPLQQIVMPQQIAWPLVFVGNAAHTLHPIAGQGFNLALRDVASLAQCIIQQGLNDAMLQSYASMRQPDQTAIMQFTNGLLNIFGNRLPGMGVLRGLGLMMMDNTRVLKSVLAHYARGYGGIVPDLVCGIPLQERENHESTV